MRTSRPVGTLVIVATILAACGSAPDPNLAARDHARPIATAAPTDAAPSQSAGPDASASVPTEAPDTTSPPAPPRVVTLAFTGDTLAHSPLWRQAQRNTGGNGFDFTPMFDDIAPVIEAVDLAVCHLETPIAPVGEEFSTDPLYGVPPEIVSAMAGAGFDRCSTASNHVLDRRTTGVDRTIEVLEFNGMGQSGMARDEAESRPSIFEVGGIAMSHLSYTYGTNGIPIPADEPWRTNLIDAPRIIDDARRARDLGAEFVFVSMHWGTEKVVAPNDEQLAVADAITASGAVDLVVGHHAHVLQPIERVNDVWVAYGLSNILSNLPVNDRWPDSSQDAAIAEFTVTVDADGTVTVDAPIVRPTWVDKNNGWVIRDVHASLADPTIGDGRRGELERSLARSADVVGEFLAE